MKSIILSAIILFPNQFSAIDPCNVELPTESHLIKDSFPVMIFYFIGGGVLSATALYMATK